MSGTLKQLDDLREGARIKRVMDEAEERRIVNALLDGSTAREVAGRHGIGADAVRAIAKKHGLRHERTAVHGWRWVR